MRNTDVYGFGARVLEIARDLLEKRFGFKFEPPEGGYMGGDYYSFERPDGE